MTLAETAAEAEVKTYPWKVMSIEWGWGPHRWLVAASTGADGMVQMQHFIKEKQKALDGITEVEAEKPFARGFWCGYEDLIGITAFMEKVKTARAANGVGCS